MLRNLSLFFVIVFGFIIVSFVGCQDGTDEDLSAIEPKMFYSAENLISTLQSKNQYESDIVIAVSGIVHEINTMNKRTTILLNGNVAQETYIICDMNSNQTSTIETTKKGDSILIKGLLKGKLKDVIMLNCVITKDH